MDWAGDTYDAQLIQDIKALCKVLFMFLPLPVFWTPFDQQGSRWVLQAQQMDGYAGQCCRMSLVNDQFHIPPIFFNQLKQPTGSDVLSDSSEKWVKEEKGFAQMGF